MNGEPLRLDALLESVADGQPIDWDALASQADGHERRILGHLRLVAGVAEVHRSIPDDPMAATHRGSAETGPVNATRWGHLVLIERIGEGSFGEVYRARDEWLDREVALKLLKPSVAHRVPATRIINEARALARLRHHNVVTVHGADMHDDRVGLWMELVRGQTLAQIVAAQGPFSADEAAVIGQEVCRALSAVHAAGMVHRDVKAQNIMRESGGRLVLMDFGAGGTPLYLAPEVLTGGEPTIAADIYAVGVLLYYLVTGRFPVAGATVRDLEAAHTRGARQRLAEARTDLPDAFVEVVERALHRDPLQRFTSATDVREALGRVPHRPPISPPVRGWYQWARALAIPALLVVLAGLLLAGVAWRGVLTPARSYGSVAVLPFRAIGSDPETVYYSDGLSEDLTAQLASLAAVHVVSGISARRYRDSAESPSDIGRALQVEALVAGTVRLSADRVHITVEVVETATAQQRWGRRFDRPRAEIGLVQAEVVQQVASAIKGALSEQDASRLQRRVPDPRAYDLYLRGRYYWNTRQEDGLRRSIAYFKDAIAIDPNAALPYAGLADAHRFSAFYGVAQPGEAHAAAEAAALAALRLDPDLAEAHAALGSLRLGQLRYAEAEASLTRAIDLNPSYPQAHHWYAMCRLQQGHVDEALAAMASARAADPFSNVLRSATAYILYAARDYDAALREYQQVLDVDPADYLTHAGVIETYAARGTAADAIRALQDARQRTGRPDHLRLSAAYVYALAGRRAESLQILTQVKADLERAPRSLPEIASVHLALGDTVGALEWLDRARAEGDGQLGFVGVDPRFDRLRSDVRFRAFIQSLGVGAR